MLPCLQEQGLEDKRMSDKTFTPEQEERYRHHNATIKQSLETIAHVPEELYQLLKSEYLENTTDDEEIKGAVIQMFEASRAHAKSVN